MQLGSVITTMMLVIVITGAQLPAARARAAVRESHQRNQYHQPPKPVRFVLYKEEVFGTGEKNHEQTPRPLSQWPMECEGAARSLDFAVIDTKKLEGAYLIIIARLGTGETSSCLNLIRLAAAEEYVLRRGSDLKYVLSQGARVKGLGRLELYVGGKLNEILPLEKNAKGYCLPGREN